MKGRDYIILFALAFGTTYLLTTASQRIATMNVTPQVISSILDERIAPLQKEIYELRVLTERQIRENAELRKDVETIKKRFAKYGR